MFLLIMQRGPIFWKVYIITTLYWAKLKLTSILQIYLILYKSTIICIDFFLNIRTDIVKK